MMPPPPRPLNDAENGADGLERRDDHLCGPLLRPFTVPSAPFRLARRALLTATVFVLSLAVAVPIAATATPFITANVDLTIFAVEFARAYLVAVPVLVAALLAGLGKKEREEGEEATKKKKKKALRQIGKGGSGRKGGFSFRRRPPPVKKKSSPSTTNRNRCVAQSMRDGQRAYELNQGPGRSACDAVPVRDLYGRTILQADVFDTVRDVKKKIAEEIGVPPGRQRLLLFAPGSAEHHQLSSASATCLDDLDAALTDYDDVCECELVVSKH
jgi:hypothetical protein